jgi:hypothetical protein
MKQVSFPQSKERNIALKLEPGSGVGFIVEHETPIKASPTYRITVNILLFFLLIIIIANSFLDCKDTMKN